MKGSENRFKSKAKNILKNSPQSIKELLEDNFEKPDVQMHRCAKPQTPNSPDRDESPQSTARLHVHIRQDLANKLLELVFQRKRNHNHYTKKEASKRAIIEEALAMYLEKNSHLCIK